MARHLGRAGAWGGGAQAGGGVVPYLVGGAVGMEQVFACPGVGSGLVSAVSAREPDVVMACVLVLTTVTVAGYTTADLIARRTA